MNASANRRWMLVGVAAALAVGLSACIGPLCDPPSPFEKAASYDWLLNDGRYAQPLNAWVRNEGLEAFLAKAVRSGGIDVVRSQYGFQCAQRPVTPPCSNRYVCSRSLPKARANVRPECTGAGLPARC